MNGGGGCIEGKGRTRCVCVIFGEFAFVISVQQQHFD